MGVSGCVWWEGFAWSRGGDVGVSNCEIHSIPNGGIYCSIITEGLSCILYQPLAFLSGSCATIPPPHFHRPAGVAIPCQL